MKEDTPGDLQDILARNRELEARVQELRETLDAIRSGEVDAIVVAKGDASRIYTLEGPDQPYRALVESISEGALTTSPEGMILYANARFASMVGVPPGQIPGTTIHDYIFESDLPAFRASFQNVPKGPCRGRVNLRLGAETLPVSISMSPLSREPGARISVVVTDRREDAEAIRARERELRTTFERFYAVLSAAYSPILLAREDGTVEFANQALCDLYGFKETPADLAGLTSQQIIDKVKTGYEHPDEALAHIRDILGRGEPVHGEEVVIRGRTVLRDFVPLRVDGNPVGRLWHHTDITELKRADEALRDSESVLRSFFDAPGDMRGIVEVVAGTDIRHVADNVVTAGFLGLTPEAMRNRLGSELGEPREILARWIGHYEESRRTGKPVHFEYADRRGEKEAWLSATVNYLGTNPAGEPRYAYVIRDITDQRQAEEALKRKQTEIQALFDNTPAGLVLFDIDPKYRVLVHNRYYQELFAEPFRSQGMAGLSVYDYAPAVEAEGVVAVFDEVVRTKKPKSFLDFPYKSNPPSQFWFNWYMAPIIIDGKVVALVSMSLDVTDRHMAVEALRESEEKFRSVLDRSADAIFRLNLATGRYLYFSPAILSIYGFSPEEMIAMSPEDVSARVNPDDQAAVQEAVRHVSESGSGQIDFRWRNKTGEYRWISANLAVTRDAAGRPLYRDGVLRDITGRKKAEEEIRLHAEELHATNEELTRFNRTMVDRELRMVELKNQVNELSGRLGEPKPYTMNLEEKGP